MPSCYQDLFNVVVLCSVNAPYNRMSMQTIDTFSCHERESAKQEQRGRKGTHFNICFRLFRVVQGCAKG